MKTEKDGGSAFPIPDTYAGRWQDMMQVRQQGMSVRDFFAAHVLPELLQHSSFCMESSAGRLFFSPTKVAATAYRIADALVLERSKDK